MAQTSSSSPYLTPHKQDLVTNNAITPQDHYGQDTHAPKPASSVVLLDNGLVDVSNVPESVRKRYNHNSSSPKCRLLRLPGEIRNMIWEYVFGDIYIGCEPRWGGRCPQYVDILKEWSPDETKRSAREPNRSIARIPEVCRQVYTETATLLYARCEVVIPHKYRHDGLGKKPNCLQRFSTQITKAARDSIKVLRVHIYCNSSISSEFEWILEAPGYRFTDIFPGLKCINVSSHEDWNYDKPEDDECYQKLLEKLGRMNRWYEGREFKILLYVDPRHDGQD